jgi:Protein of unknown function (DUF1552)
MPRRSIISRRAVLRGVLAGGVSVAVPLPRLGAMFNGNGTAYANGTSPPMRYGHWFFGNGIIPDRWVPSNTGIGDAWTLSEQLEPLLEVKPWLSVVTGLDIKIPDTAAHATMPAVALSGSNMGPVGGSPALPTTDQVVAGIVGGGTTFPTGIHVGASNSNGGSGLGTNLSFSGPGAPNPPNFSPEAIFTQLMQFANSSTGMPMPPSPDLMNRGMVLDAVSGGISTLRARLGADDQHRLDQHLEGIQQLQTQITRAQGQKVSGVLTDPNMAYPNRGNDGSLTIQITQAMSDLLVFAMSTDLTRIFSFLWTPAATFQSYSDCGLQGGFHGDFGHRQSPQGPQYATVGFNIGVRYAMQSLNYLLVKMKDTPDGAGCLLDNSCVFSTSCVAESTTHSNLDYPLLLAGKAGGKFKGNQHVRLVGDNSSKVPFTVLQAYGSTETTFGQNEGQVSSGIPELLA